MTPDLAGFLGVCRAMLPERPRGRPPLADWLAMLDVNELWTGAKAAPETVVRVA